MASAHGSCLCKTVEYEVELPFERFMYCHCTRCRKATGSPHAANGFVKPETFRWIKGADAVKRDGGTFYAFEWRNPRPGKVIREVRLHGASGFRNLTATRPAEENDVVLAGLSVVKKQKAPEVRH
jgi:hypothetical protein